MGLIDIFRLGAAQIAPRAAPRAAAAPMVGAAPADPDSARAFRDALIASEARKSSAALAAAARAEFERRHAPAASTDATASTALIAELTPVASDSPRLGLAKATAREFIRRHGAENAAPAIAAVRALAEGRDISAARGSSAQPQRVLGAAARR